MMKEEIQTALDRIVEILDGIVDVQDAMNAEIMKLRASLLQVEYMVKKS